MKVYLRGTAIAAAILATASIAQAEPTLTVTSPTDGASVSRSATPTMTVAGTVAFETPAPSTSQFFLRRSACASGDDDARLSTESGGSSEQGGCGFIAQPANEVLIAAGQEPLSNNYATADGMPITLDASKPVTGTVKMGAGVGVVTTEFVLTGTSAANQPLDLGRFSTTYNGTAGTRTIALSIPLDTKLDKVDVKAMNLQVITRGANVQSGSVDHRNGGSFLNIPTYTAGFTPVVEFSTSSAFSGARKATLGSGGTWTGTLSTPTVGAYKLYVRAVQGAQRTDAAPVSFTVTP